MVMDYLKLVYIYQVSTEVTHSHPPTRTSIVVCWLIKLTFVNRMGQYKKKFYVVILGIDVAMCDL